MQSILCPVDGVLARRFRCIVRLRPTLHATLLVRNLWCVGERPFYLGSNLFRQRYFVALARLCVQKIVELRIDRPINLLNVSRHNLTSIESPVHS